MTKKMVLVVLSLMVSLAAFAQGQADIYGGIGLGPNWNLSGPVDLCITGEIFKLEKEFISTYPAVVPNYKISGFRGQVNIPLSGHEDDRTYGQIEYIRNINYPFFDFIFISGGLNFNTQDDQFNVGPSAGVEVCIFESAGNQGNDMFKINLGWNLMNTSFKTISSETLQNNLRASFLYMFLTNPNK